MAHHIRIDPKNVNITGVDNLDSTILSEFTFHHGHVEQAITSKKDLKTIGINPKNIPNPPATINSNSAILRKSPNIPHLFNLFISLQLWASVPLNLFINVTANPSIGIKYNTNTKRYNNFPINFCI